MDIVKAFTTNGLHTDIIIKGNIDDPLFRASDIGEILEMGNIRSTLQNFDNTEKVVHSMDTHGGKQQVTFLTEKGLYKILFKSRKPIAEQFQNWVCDVIKEIRTKGKYDLEEKNKKIEDEKKELENKLIEIEEENKLLQIRETIPIIYIYNTTPLAENPILKIGYTTKNIQERIKPYITPNGKGKLEFTIEVPDNNVNNFEKFIHGVFSRYLIRSEVFQIGVEEAKMIVYRIVNTLTLMNLSNDDERKLKISKLHNYELEIIENKPREVKIIRDMSTQTDFNENVFVPINNNEKNELTKKFDKFIEEHCIVRDDVEVSTTDIIGQYRILAKSTSKEVYSSLKDYLDKRFKQYRLKIQDKNQVVNGYAGVILKEIRYEKLEILSNPQNFIFHSCNFSPSGKVLCSDLYKEYKKWKEQLKIPILDNDEDELKEYLKKTNYVLLTVLWANNGNGYGYYGMSLKKDTERHRYTSSTGKKVEKRSKNGDLLLGTWETIAKAAEVEKMCAAKMSRSIKNKVLFNDDYYYCT